MSDRPFVPRGGAITAIIAALQAHGPMTVAQLAACVGRNPASIKSAIHYVRQRVPGQLLYISGHLRTPGQSRAENIYARGPGVDAVDAAFVEAQMRRRLSAKAEASRLARNRKQSEARAAARVETKRRLIAEAARKTKSGRARLVEEVLQAARTRSDPLHAAFFSA